MSDVKLRRYHSAVWDEPVVFDLSVPGRRGCHFPEAGPALDKAVGDAASLVPNGMRRETLIAIESVEY